MFDCWRNLKASFLLPNDDAIAVYLPYNHADSLILFIHCLFSSSSTLASFITVYSSYLAGARYVAGSAFTVASCA